MNISIQTVHFDADEKLLDLVQKKLEKLATFHDRITRVEVFLKLDNLVQIAHNVEIGSNSVIAAQVGVSGSTKIGKNVMVGGQAGFAGHLTIADGIKIAGGAGVTKTFTTANMTLAGYPAIEQKQSLRNQVYVKNLPELEKRVQELEILVQQLSKKA